MSDRILEHSSDVPHRPRADSTSAAISLKRELDEARAELDDVRRQNAELAAIRHKLEDERRRYRAVFEMASDAYVLTDLTGLISEANGTAAALLSVRPSFLVDKSLLMFVAEEARADLEGQINQWHSALTSDSRPPATRRGQILLRVYKGATFPADFAVGPLTDSVNHVIGWRWILRDLSESTQILQALQESEYHYRMLFDSAGDAIFIHNLTGRFLEANRVACDSLGYARDELLLMTPSDIVAPNLVSQIPTLNARLRQDEQVFFETVFVRRDGVEYPVELNSRVIEYAGGPAVLSIARDITDRKRTEEDLSRRLRQLALLNDVGRQIAGILGLDQVLAQAAQLVHESFGYHHVALFVIDPERGELVMKAIAGNFVDLFPHEHHVTLGQGMVGWVADHGEQLCANNVELEPHYVNFYPELIPTRSELSVPLRIGTQTIGVFDIQSPRYNSFDDDDIRVLETLADQIAVAIANARLYESARQGRGKPLLTD